MTELKCYDGYGNTINSIAQWSVNQVIYIKNMNFSSAPVALFSNQHEEYSYVVNTQLVSGKVKITIPNLLTQVAQTLTIGINVYDSNDKISRTSYFVRLPIRPADMPSNYVFTENTQTATLSDLQSQVNGKLDISHGTGNANKIAAIGSDGRITFLTLGAGLQISNGVLSAS